MGVKPNINILQDPNISGLYLTTTDSLDQCHAIYEVRIRHALACLSRSIRVSVNSDWPRALTEPGKGCAQLDCNGERRSVAFSRSKQELINQPLEVRTV